MESERSVCPTEVSDDCHFDTILVPDEVGDDLEQDFVFVFSVPEIIPKQA